MESSGHVCMAWSNSESVFAFCLPIRNKCSEVLKKNGFCGLRDATFAVSGMFLNRKRFGPTGLSPQFGECYAADAPALNLLDPGSLVSRRMSQTSPIRLAAQR